MKIDFGKPPRNLDEAKAYHDEAVRLDKEHQIENRIRLHREIKTLIQSIEELLQRLKEKHQELQDS